MNVVSGPRNPYRMAVSVSGAVPRGRGRSAGPSSSPHRTAMSQRSTQRGASAGWRSRRPVGAAPRRRGWSAAKELFLYVAHGMDHLSGADDHAPCDYAAMRRRELGWLRALERGEGR